MWLSLYWILFVYFLILPSLLHSSILFNCFYTCNNITIAGYSHLCLRYRHHRIISGCQRILLASFLLAASTCCCQKIDWNESFGRLSKNAELSDELANSFKSLWDCSSRETPPTSDASAIFFSRSSCLDRLRCWCWSWPRRLISVGRGWYLIT